MIDAGQDAAYIMRITAALDKSERDLAEIRARVGPARIVEVPPLMESSNRYCEVYCPTCTTHECSLSEDDPRLMARLDEHNRDHANRPLPWPGDSDSLHISDLEREISAQAATIRAVEAVIHSGRPLYMPDEGLRLLVAEIGSILRHAATAQRTS